MLDLGTTFHKEAIFFQSFHNYSTSTDIPSRIHHTETADRVTQVTFTYDILHTLWLIGAV